MLQGMYIEALKKKLTKSAHPLKEDLQLCLLDLLDDGDEESDESQDWIASINRGGLTCINNTFELFHAKEHELHKHLSMSQAPNLADHVHASIMEMKMSSSSGLSSVLIGMKTGGLYFYRPQVHGSCSFRTRWGVV